MTTGKIRSLAEFERWLDERSASYPPPSQQGSFNEFLRKRDSEQARLNVRDLDHHGVVVWAWHQMRRFMDDHPGYFRKLTPEQIAAGRESVQSLWREYEEKRRVMRKIPLRSLADQMRRAGLRISS